MEMKIDFKDLQLRVREAESAAKNGDDDLAKKLRLEIKALSDGAKSDMVRRVLDHYTGLLDRVLLSKSA